MLFSFNRKLTAGARSIIAARDARCLSVKPEEFIRFLKLKVYKVLCFTIFGF